MQAARLYRSPKACCCCCCSYRPLAGGEPGRSKVQEPCMQGDLTEREMGGWGRRGGRLTMFAWRWNLQNFVSLFFPPSRWMIEWHYIWREESSYWTWRLLLWLVFKIRPGFYCEVVISPSRVCVHVCMCKRERWECISGINNGVKEQKRRWFSGEASCKNVHMWLSCSLSATPSCVFFIY